MNPPNIVGSRVPLIVVRLKGGTAKQLICDCVHLISLAVAEMIRGKTPEEIRTHFNIKNDFTPEEEEQVRRENEW